MRLTIGSLCSGIGGLDIGIELALGAEVLWHVEQDERCRRILARHWPDARQYVDVRHVGADVLAPVDVVIGGPPCQGASHAGKRLGQADERWLWGEYLRVVGELEPLACVAENVPGLLTVEGGAAFGAVLADLAALGFDAEWDVLGAHHVRAPHKRDRVWIRAWHPARLADARRRGRFGPHDEVRAAWHAALGRGALADAADARRERADARPERGGLGGPGANGGALGDAAEPRRPRAGGGALHAGARPQAGPADDGAERAGGVADAARGAGAQEPARDDVVDGERQADGRRAVEPAEPRAGRRDGERAGPAGARGPGAGAAPGGDARDVADARGGRRAGGPDVRGRQPDAGGRGEDGGAGRPAGPDGGRRHGVYVRLEPGHLAPDAGHRGGDGRRRFRSARDRSGVPWEAAAADTPLADAGGLGHGELGAALDDDGREPHGHEPDGRGAGGDAAAAAADVADARGLGRGRGGPRAGAPRDEPDGAAGGRLEGPGDAAGGGDAGRESGGHVADAHGVRREGARRAGPARGLGRRPADARGADGDVGDPDGARLARRGDAGGGADERAARAAGGARAGDAPEDAAQPGVGDPADGPAGWLARFAGGLRWPAPPGEPQHAWEAARTQPTGDWTRRPKLRALGNAVVWPCAYVVGVRLGWILCDADLEPPAGALGPADDDPTDRSHDDAAA